MPTIPGKPSPQQSLRALQRRYGDQWEIVVHADLPVYTAEHKSADGRAIRYLVAHSVAELAAKLQTAGTVEP